MNCRQFQQRLNQRLDGRSQPSQDARLRAHADACPDCAVLLQLQREVFELFGRPMSPVHRLGPQAAPIRGGGTTVRRVGWAIAVSLTVLVTAWWSVERPTDPVARRDRPDRSVDASVVSDSVDRVPLTTSPSRWRTSISIASPVAWGLVVHRADLAGYEDWTRLTDRPIPFGWWQPIEAGLAPLTRSLSSAVNILRSIWPSADDAALDSVSDFSSCVATQVS